MSGRTYFKHEIVQWGYVALVCIALAFTSMTRAFASTKPSEYQLEVQKTSKWDACFPSNGAGETPAQKMCETQGDFMKSEPIQSILGSTFLDSSFDHRSGGSPLLSPLH